jgi:hypothetical protein
MAHTNCDHWDGEERRLAGNYPGRTAIIFDRTPIPAATTVALQALPPTAAPELQRLGRRMIQRQYVQSQQHSLLHLIQKRRTR